MSKVGRQQYLWASVTGIGLLGMLTMLGRKPQAGSATTLPFLANTVRVQRVMKERTVMNQQSVFAPQQDAWSEFKRYHYGLDPQNVVYIHLPNGASDQRRVPLAILVHGGNYLFGSATDYSMLPLARYFMEQGYAVASVDYRTLQHHRWPVPVEDVRQAISYIFRSIGDRVEHTTYVGYSAGAVTGALLLYTQQYGYIDGIDRFVGLSGLYDKVAASHEPIAAIRSQSLEHIDLLRVIEHIRHVEDHVPALLVEGSRDYFADQFPGTANSHAERLAAVLNAQHIPAQTFWANEAGLDGHDGPIGLFTQRDPGFISTLERFLKS